MILRKILAVREAVLFWRVKLYFTKVRAWRRYIVVTTIQAANRAAPEMYSHPNSHADSST